MRKRLLRERIGKIEEGTLLRNGTFANGERKQREVPTTSARSILGQGGRLYLLREDPCPSSRMYNGLLIDWHRITNLQKM